MKYVDVLIFIYLRKIHTCTHVYMYILMYAHNSSTHICACAYIDTLCTCI